MEKRTKKIIFTEIAQLSQIQDNKEYVEFIQNEIALISKKRVSKASEERTKEIAGIKKNILLVITNTPTSITDIQKANPTSLGIYTNQKLSPIFKALSENGEIVRTEIKGRPLYSSVAEEIEIPEFEEVDEVEEVDELED